MHSLLSGDVRFKVGLPFIVRVVALKGKSCVSRKDATQPDELERAAKKARRVRRQDLPHPQLYCSFFLSMCMRASHCVVCMRHARPGNELLEVHNDAMA